MFGTIVQAKDLGAIISSSFVFFKAFAVSHWEILNASADGLLTWNVATVVRVTDETAIFSVVTSWHAVDVYTFAPTRLVIVMTLAVLTTV